MADNFEKENQALLVPTEEKTDTPGKEAPRRNTKKSIIEKIKNLCQQHDLPLEESDTTLQRSSKTQLNRLLAKKTEELLQKKMKHNVMQNKTEESDSMREMMCVATLTC